MNRLSFLPPQKAPAAFRAGWVMVSPDRIERNACVETVGYRVSGVCQKPSAGNIQDLGPGLIMPLLVNAHTHLELSALKGKVEPSRGFESWVKDLLVQRDQLGHEKLAASARDEINRLRNHGTGAVGEISTLGLTREILTDAGMSGVWFQEILGSQLDAETLSLEKADSLSGDTGRLMLSASLAGHAPHTTSPEVLKAIKAATRKRGLPFSIHAGESQAESAFLRGENPDWLAFLASRGIESDQWPVGKGMTPVAYLDALSLLGPDTLGVHLIDTTEDDLERLSRTETNICLCPRSNAKLHGRLPDIQAMLDRGIAPALGTDSLASCASLSLFDEMAFVRNTWPGIAPETVLAMAGVNGAKALGLSGTVGQLAPGFWAGCLYVDLRADSSDDVRERLTTYEF